jgi:hypothetical protein
MRNLDDFMPLSDQRPSQPRSLIQHRRSVRLLLLTCLSAGGINHFCFAENIVFDYLISEPMSLMDAGIMRIETVLSRLNTDRSQRPENTPALTGSVDVIGGHLLVAVRADKQTDHSPFPSCEDLVAFVEHRLGFCFREDFDNLGPLRPGECGNKFRKQFLSGALDRYFSHHGYATEGRPEKLGDLLAQFVIVEVVVVPHEGRKQACHRLADGPIAKGSWLEQWLQDKSDAGP